VLARVWAVSDGHVPMHGPMTAGVTMRLGACACVQVDGIFVLEDWHNFGVDYDRTLMAWNDNFEASWPRFSERYGERFHRMWRYYLLTCAGSFRSRYNQLYQLTLSKRGVRGGWKPVR